MDSVDIFMIVILLLIIVPPFIVYFYCRKKLNTHKGIHSSLRLIKEELQKAETELETIRNETVELQELKNNAYNLASQLDETKQQLRTSSSELISLKAQKDEYITTLNRLQCSIDLYSTLEEFTAQGHFEIPDYLYQTSERFAEEIKLVREQQKSLILSKEAITYPDNALNAVIGTKADGKRALDGQVKMMLLAFNEDCDLLISKVRPGFYMQTLERISAKADELEKLSIHFQCQFNLKYIELKLKECTLQYQYRLKKQEEDEEQRAIREQIREEQRAQKEYEKAIAEAEREEKLYQSLLDKARIELKSTNAEKMAEIQSHISLLEQQLAEAQSKEQRAKSLAEQTRCGHIYVISNIGSFGENIYKIGLTRRLDPMDRIKELGDASVPFFFDVHAIIYSDDAPTLERKLHHKFENKRVNAVNYRREFFAVELNEIRKAVIELTGKSADFRMTALAEEYRETQRIRGY